MNRSRFVHRWFLVFCLSLIIAGGFAQAQPAKHNAAKEGVGDKAQFMKADLFESDFSKAQVITMFLLPSINLKLRPKILDLKPGTRVVSNSFTMEDWEADQTETISGDCSNWCTALLWIV